MAGGVREGNLLPSADTKKVPGLTQAMLSLSSVLLRSHGSRQAPDQWSCDPEAL